MRRPSFVICHLAAALLLLTGTSACSLFGTKTQAPEREYTPEEQELRADYKLAKDSNDRDVSACIWDYTKLLEKLEAGPKADSSSTQYQSDVHCRAALEQGTPHADLANKYIAKFAQLEQSRTGLIADSKKIKNERDMEQCMSHVHEFEDKRDGVNVAAFLVRCIEMFEQLPEPERTDIPDTQQTLDDLRTRHATLLANFERMKQDPAFTQLVDDHLRLADEKALLELRIHELEQLPNSAEALNAKSTADARLRKVQEQMASNLEQRKPFYAQYDVVLR